MKWSLCLLVGSALTTAIPAVAQQPAFRLPSQAEPGRPPEAINPPVRPPEPPVELDLPAPSRSAQPQSVDDYRFEVVDIAPTGNTIFSRADLAAELAPAIGKSVTLKQVLAAADAVEARYRRAGYPLTRVLVPPQRVEDKIFHIDVIEGYIETVAVEGGSPDTAARVKRLLEPVRASRPASLSVLERCLLLAGDLPGVTARGVLKPSSATGAADLVVTVSEEPFSGTVNINNRSTKFSGPWTLTGSATANNILGQGEEIGLTFSTTPEFSEQRFGALRYRQPVDVSIGDGGLTAGFDASYGNGDPGASLRALDAHSESYRVGPALSYPLIRSRLRTLSLDASVAAASSSVDLLGEKFSKDVYRVAELRANYRDGDFVGGSLQASTSIAQGIDVAGATARGDRLASRPGADPGFTKVGFDAQAQRPLVDAVSLSLTVGGQYSFSTLYSGEQYAIGGSRIGRGYDAATVTGDSGIGSAVELRYDLDYHDDIVSSGQIYGFYDIGRAWNRAGSASGGGSLASTGLGVRTVVRNQALLGLELAQPLTRPPSTGSNNRPLSVYVDLTAAF